MTPFDYLNTINDTKQDIMVDDVAERAYVPFVINRTLSYFPDTVALANELNRYHHLDKKLQYHFLINIIRKRKRFSKWIKPDLVSDMDVVKQYYGYSNEKARQVLHLLSAKQIEELRKKVSKGGRK
jgi:Bacteriophage clamp loader A subunit